MSIAVQQSIPVQNDRSSFEGIREAHQGLMLGQLSSLTLLKQTEPLFKRTILYNKNNY